MNVQVLTDPFGRLLRASPALPGSTHDLTAARQHGSVEALADANLKCWADTAYQGAGEPVRGPFRGRRLKRWKRRHNSTHAEIRCLGEQALAGPRVAPIGRCRRRADSPQSEAGGASDAVLRRYSALMRWASSSWSSRMMMRQAASMGVPWSTSSRARAAMRSW